MSVPLAAQHLVPFAFDWSEACRDDRVAIVKKLREAGWLNRQIGEWFGATPGTISTYFSDPDRAKRKAQLDRLSGVCVECGGPTRGGQSHKQSVNGASLRCRWCARGKRRPRNAERLTVPVRLCDLPVDVRLAGAAVAARIEADENERLELLFAAIDPSDRVYWVSESARPLLEQWQEAA